MTSGDLGLGYFVITFMCTCTLHYVSSMHISLLLGNNEKVTIIIDTDTDTNMYYRIVVLLFSVILNDSYMYVDTQISMMTNL